MGQEFPSIWNLQATITSTWNSKRLFSSRSINSTFDSDITQSNLRVLRWLEILNSMEKKLSKFRWNFHPFLWRWHHPVFVTNRTLNAFSLFLQSTSSKSSQCPMVLVRNHEGHNKGSRIKAQKNYYQDACELCKKMAWHWHYNGKNWFLQMNQKNYTDLNLGRKPYINQIL